MAVTVTNELVTQAKRARRITSNSEAINDDVRRLLSAAFQDLGVAGALYPDDNDLLPLYNQAAITYFLANFGNPENYDRLKKSYDEQKAQLSMRTGYTDWLGADQS